MSIAKLPLVCVETLLTLQDSLGGQQNSCRTFINRYVEMWPGRFDRIHAALNSGDNEKALDSALSLRSSSLMVGAAQLGGLTDDLIDLLQCHRHSAATRKLLSLQRCGNETAGQLAAFCFPTD